MFRLTKTLSRANIPVEGYKNNFNHITGRTVKANDKIVNVNMPLKMAKEQTLRFAWVSDKPVYKMYSITHLKVSYIVCAWFLHLYFLAIESTQQS